jgi:hypothetical protein
MWKEIALSVSPMNKDAAKEAICRAYVMGRVRPPQSFIFLGSPVAGTLAAATVAKFARSVYLDVVQNVKAQIAAKFSSQCETNKNSQWWHRVARELTSNQRDKIYADLPDAIRAAVRLWVNTSVNDFSELPLDGWYEDDPGEKIMDILTMQLPLELAEKLPLTVQRGAIAGREATFCGAGNQDAHFLQLYDFAHKEGFNIPEVEPLCDIAKNCGWFWPFAGFCIVSDRPKLLAIDKYARLHNGRGPAVQYRDGLHIYSWEGSSVPARVINFSQHMNAHDIETEPNLEVRRFMIDMFGLDKFMLAAGARKIHTDETGSLYMKDMLDDEPLVLVEVINRTPEPDGHFKRYFLRVPPNIRTAREAVAWTFALHPEHYKPIRET